MPLSMVSKMVFVLWPGTAYVDRVDDRYWNTARIGNLRGDYIGRSTMDGKSVFTGSIIAAFADQNDLVLRSNRTFARHL